MIIKIRLFRDQGPRPRNKSAADTCQSSFSRFQPVAVGGHGNQRSRERKFCAMVVFREILQVFRLWEEKGDVGAGGPAFAGIDASGQLNETAKVATLTGIDCMAGRQASVHL